LVCLPKAEGGLGVLNLQTQNEALLLNNLHKFLNRHDIPWVHLIWESHYSNGSFWWTDNLKLLNSFKDLAMANVFDGASCLFLDDLWLNKVPKLHYPKLFSFAKFIEISIKTARNVEGL